MIVKWLLNRTSWNNEKHQYSSLFDYAMRELGYSEGAAWRRIKAMRLCSDTAGTRERLQDGSLTLSAAAQLQNTFDLAAAHGHRRRGPGRGTRGTGAAPARCRGDAGGWGFGGRGSGASATGAGAGRGAAAGAGGAGERQEHPRGEAVVGRGGSRAGAAGRSHARAGRRPLGAEGGDRLCLSVRDRAATGAAVARGPAPDAGAARGAAGAGRPAALRPGAAAAWAQR